MPEIFLGLVALMLTVYVVLDGFDFGAGTVSLLVARTDHERRAIISAIGPFWDGNEVWLIASGGVLMAAFPAALAAAFSGLYLAMFMVVWALILRGMTIEMLLHMKDGVARTLCTFVFGGASASLSLLFGVALGNVVRGIPLSGQAELDVPLFTSLLPRAPVGVIDVYTLLMGVLAVSALALHGALYLAWKAEDPLRARVRKAVPPLFVATAVLYLVAVGATSLFVPLGARALPGLLCALVAFAFAFTMHRRGAELRAFLGSCAFLAASLLGLAHARGAIVLADVGHRADMTAAAALSPEGPLRPMLGICAFGIVLVALYFANLFRLHQGKLTPDEDHDEA
jgi:cytochrome d ubiquinol oxidase subunit II